MVNWISVNFALPHDHVNVLVNYIHRKGVTYVVEASRENKKWYMQDPNSEKYIEIKNVIHWAFLRESPEK